MYSITGLLTVQLIAVLEMSANGFLIEVFLTTLEIRGMACYINYY